MRHKRIQKWLSDSKDRELPGKRRKILGKHLEKCGTCSSYAKDLERIALETRKIKRTEVDPSYWEDFTLRLRAKISSLSQEKKGAAFFRRWKWAFAAAASVVVIALGLLLYLAQSQSAQETYVFSFEESLNQIYQEIGDDSELEESFNSMILASIGEATQSSGETMRLDLSENPLLWDSLSEEEMGLLESELKKKIKSKED